MRYSRQEKTKENHAMRELDIQKKETWGNRQSHGDKTVFTKQKEKLDKGKRKDNGKNRTG